MYSKSYSLPKAPKGRNKRAWGRQRSLTYKRKPTHKKGAQSENAGTDTIK